MTNQEAFESARAGDWIAESFARVGDVFDIGGTSTGYSSFADCLTDGQSIFYAAFDENDNREAGLAVWDANARTLTPVEIHATLQAGKFTKGDPDPVPFKLGGTITGTFNATAFNAMWSHVWEKGNPHETEAKDVNQNNSNLLGDTVQEALDKVADFILSGEIDGGIDIDIGDLDGSLAENIVLQDRTDAQKVVSDFSFEKAGDNPLTMKDTGMYAGTEYVRNKSNVWEVDPSLSVTNDISAGGNLSVQGTTELKGDLTLEGGDLIFNGGGIEGDVSVNGNITLEGGGAIISPDGTPIGGGAAGTHIGELPPDSPEQGQFWLDISGEAVMWIYDESNGGQWLQHPSAGGGGTVTTTDVQLDQPTVRMPSGATTQADANAYFATALQNVVDEDGNSLVDLSDYYTSTEVDTKLADYPTVAEVDTKLGDYHTKTEAEAAFQPIGDYIEDAPSDGELYVRKDGAWELYTPSSGGGGGGYMVPITPPQTAGDYIFGIRSGGGSSVFKDECGAWFCQKSATTATFTVPAGYKFVLQNFTPNGANKDVMFEGILFDGQQINKSSELNGKYKTVDVAGQNDYDKRHFWPTAQNFIIESSAVFTLRNTGDNWFHIFGYFIPADNTRESAQLREAYLAEEAERIAAMPQPEPEVGTQEVSDE